MNSRKCRSKIKLSTPDTLPLFSVRRQWYGEDNSAAGAIALPLSLATRQIHRVTDFDWLGFLPGRYQRWGSPHTELEVSFSPEEIEATRAVARRWANGWKFAQLTHSYPIDYLTQLENLYTKI